MVVSIVIFIIQPSITTLAFVVLHSLVYLVVAILTHWHKKKGWGIVADASKSKLLANTVVRLFEPAFNRLIESTVTDAKGRYAFMAGPNQYFMTFERPGYEKQEVRPIDFSSNKEPDVISVDVSLKKVGN